MKCESKRSNALAKYLSGRRSRTSYLQVERVPCSFRSLYSPFISDPLNVNISRLTLPFSLPILLPLCRVRGNVPQTGQKRRKVPKINKITRGSVIIIKSSENTPEGRAKTGLVVFMWGRFNKGNQVGGRVRYGDSPQRKRNKNRWMKQRGANGAPLPS